MTDYEIFKVTQYNIKKVESEKGNINKICTKINNDCSYHLKLFDNQNYILFGDIYHC